MSKFIQARREKVYFLLVQEKTEAEIAEITGVSRRTIIRDVAFLKKSASQWLDGLARGGFVFEYQVAISRIQENVRRLDDLYLQAGTIAEKLQVLRLKNETEKLLMEFLGGAPTVHAFRRAIGK